MPAEGLMGSVALVFAGGDPPTAGALRNLPTLDHFLANVLLLASPELSALTVEARLADARVFVVRDAVELRGSPGELCSLLALGGAAHGVRTEGLEFPLRGETLYPGSTRGVSN